MDKSDFLLKYLFEFYIKKQTEHIFIVFGLLQNENFILRCR